MMGPWQFPNAYGTGAYHPEPNAVKAREESLRAIRGAPYQVPTKISGNRSQ